MSRPKLCSDVPTGSALYLYPLLQRPESRQEAGGMQGCRWPEKAQAVEHVALGSQDGDRRCRIPLRHLFLQVSVVSGSWGKVGSVLAVARRGQEPSLLRSKKQLVHSGENRTQRSSEQKQWGCSSHPKLQPYPAAMISRWEPRACPAPGSMEQRLLVCVTCPFAVPMPLILSHPLV